MIHILRVDDRLLHGQVVMQWTSRFGITAIVVANDEIYQEEVKVMAMKMAAPPGVKVAVRSVADAIRVLNNPKGEKMRMMVIVNSPTDALRICQGVPNVQRVNLGNYGRRKEGREEGGQEQREAVALNVSLDAADIQAVREMLRLGVPVDAQNTPQSSMNELTKFKE